MRIQMKTHDIESLAYAQNSASTFSRNPASDCDGALAPTSIAQTQTVEVE